MLNRLEQVYVATFAETAPLEQWRNALRPAASLSCFDMAVRYRHQPPSVVRLHPWMRALVPQALGVGARSVMRYNHACLPSYCPTKMRRAPPSGDIAYGLLVTVDDL